MSRKQLKRKAGNMAHTVIAGFFILVIVGGVGLGMASASASASSVDDIAHAGAFGFSEVTHTATASTRQAPVPAQAAPEQLVFYERSALASTAPRDIEIGMRMIDDMERIEQERLAADNANAPLRAAEKKAMQGFSSASDYGLSAVDWTVGRHAFVAEWTQRIDAYLAGSPLAGYGKVFAEAAWENGVDPRWSPAISNTESTKGSVCFMPFNAWGWGESGWNDWESAIRAHVAGLGDVYGYSVTVTAAQIYCPPNWANWYADTLGQMAEI